MEYRTISAKVPINELTLFKNFCEKKGVTPASLIRELVLRELKIPIPHTVAGRNKISYDKKNDSFTWSIELDKGNHVKILRNVSPAFIENLHENTFFCPAFLPIPAFAQTVTALTFINSSFSAILGISRIQLAQVSND